MSRFTLETYLSEYVVYDTLMESVLIRSKDKDEINNMVILLNDQYNLIETLKMECLKFKLRLKDLGCEYI